MQGKDYIPREPRIGISDRSYDYDLTTLKEYDDLESIKTEDLEKEFKRSILARDEKLRFNSSKTKSDHFCQTVDINQNALSKDDWMEKLTKLESMVEKLVSLKEEKLNLKQDDVLFRSTSASYSQSFHPNQRSTEGKEHQDLEKQLSSAKLELEEREDYYRNKISTLENSKLQLRKDLENVKQQLLQNNISWKKQLNDMTVTMQLKVSEVVEGHVSRMETMKKEHDVELLEVVQRKNAEIKQLKKLIQDCQNSKETMALETREFEKRSENILKELKTDIEIVYYDMLVTLKNNDSFSAAEELSNELNSDPGPINPGDVVSEMKTLKTVAEQLMRRFAELREKSRNMEATLEQWKHDKADELTRARRKFTAEKLEALEQMKERLLNATSHKNSTQSVKSN